MKRLGFSFAVLLLTLASMAAFAGPADQGQDPASLEKELAKDPDNPSLLLSLGRLYLDSGDYLKARELLKRTVGIDSTNAKAFALIGRTYISEAMEGYSQEIQRDTDYQTKLVVSILSNLGRAVALDPDDPEIRFTRAAATIEMPVFVGFFERFRGDMASTITREMIENDFTGFLGQAAEDLKVVARSAVPDTMKAEAYYYLGLLYNRMGLQYWQTLTKDYKGAAASKKAWSAMGPDRDWIEPESAGGERVQLRFHIGFESDLPPQTAVWVEDADGNFVRSLYVSDFSAYAGEKQVVLPAWAAMSKFETDAATGASISMGRHFFVWDLKDGEGLRVEDARYVIKVEAHHWPSMHYQQAGLEVSVGGGPQARTLSEGDLVPFMEVKYIPE